MKTATEWITKIRKSTKRDVDEQLKRQDHVDKILLRIPGDAYRYVIDAYYGTYSHVILYIPWNQDMEDHTLEVLNESGWKIVGTHFYDTEGSMKIELNHPDLENDSTFWNDLTIYKNSNYEGSTCKRVEAGTKTVTIYEMECIE